MRIPGNDTRSLTRFQLRPAPSISIEDRKVRVIGKNGALTNISSGRCDRTLWGTIDPFGIFVLNDLQKFSRRMVWF